MQGGGPRTEFRNVQRGAPPSRFELLDYRAARAACRGGHVAVLDLLDAAGFPWSMACFADFCREERSGQVEAWEDEEAILRTIEWVEDKPTAWRASVAAALDPRALLGSARPGSAGASRLAALEHEREFVAALTDRQGLRRRLPAPATRLSADAGRVILEPLSPRSTASIGGAFDVGLRGASEPAELTAAWSAGLMEASRPEVEFWDATNAMLHAARWGYYRVVRMMRQSLRCKWDMRTSVLALRHCEDHECGFKLLDYLRMAACPFDGCAVSEAIRTKNLVAAKWLKAQGAQWLTNNAPFNYEDVIRSWNSMARKKGRRAKRREKAVNPRGDFWASSSAMDLAVDAGAANIIAWLRGAVNPPCPWGKHECTPQLRREIDREMRRQQLR
jgi:hypothetical protein